jgi:hypothetical protein
MVAVWQEAQQRLIEVFARTTLADACRGCGARNDASSFGKTRGAFADRAELALFVRPVAPQGS